ncbi:MAG: CerR family C-terminal domain-containing protein, partial [Limisphaerales bacterium]
PTAGFEILYTEGFRHLHDALCFLVGTALEKDWRDRETILRTHMFMGQVYFFAMSREAILRRLGWKSLEGRNAQLVVDILDEHIETLISGLLKPRAAAPATPALADKHVLTPEPSGASSRPDHSEQRSQK